MKQIACIPAGALTLAFTASLHAAPPPGTTQQRTSPDHVPDGLAKSDWQSIRAAYEAGRHAFAPVEGGWQARNPGQQWTTTFDGRGFVAEPRDGGWQWGLELKSYGFPGAERVVGGVPVVKAGGQRLTYDWDAAVQEWLVNDARGLEHGFTVKERPRKALNSQISTLSFLLVIRGTLRPRVSADAQGVAFQDGSGATVLNYSGLKVWDADGKRLPSRFELADSQLCLRLLVEEHGARYPLTIDPIAQQAYLKAHQVNANDSFGSSVALAGDTVVVGASGEDSSTTGINSTPDESASRAGAAYVFVRSGTTWTQQAYLKAHQVNVDDFFGSSVAVSGDTVVVGAYGEDSSTTGVNSIPNESSGAAGAAYVFTGVGPSPDADGDGLLDSWELTHWPTIINHSALDDFDDDGYVELLELALGLNPTIPNAGGLPPVTDEGGYLTMTITKRPGVAYEVQSAGTLLNGQPDSFSPASTSVLMNDATTLKVQDNIFIGSAPGRFMRVKVTAAP